MTPSPTPAARAARAVLIDAAGTLIRPAQPVGATYSAVAAEHGAPITPQTLTNAFREVFPRMPPMAFPPVEPHELDLLERGWWRRLVRGVLARCDARVDDFDAFFDALYARFAEARAWRTFEEVDRVLDQFTAAGLRLAIVSNFDSRLEGIAEGLGLAARVDAVIYSTRAGFAKPHPAIFAAALDRLGVSAADAVHVGDSHMADYAGARSAGIPAWLLERDGPRDPSDRTVRDLDEFAAKVLGGV